MQTQIQFTKTQTQINAGTQSETCTQVHEMKKWIGPTHKPVKSSQTIFMIMVMVMMVMVMIVTMMMLMMGGSG